MPKRVDELCGEGTAAGAGAYSYVYVPTSMNQAIFYFLLFLSLLFAFSDELASWFMTLKSCNINGRFRRPCCRCFSIHHQVASVVAENNRKRGEIPIQ